LLPPRLLHDTLAESLSSLNNHSPPAPNPLPPKQSPSIKAYLRLCGVDFAVERCGSAGASPTGALPGLELGTDLAGAVQPTDLAAARSILQHLRKSGQAGLDLDAALEPAQRAEVAAFGLLVQSRLEPATLWTTWLERRGFQEFRKVRWGLLDHGLTVQCGCRCQLRPTQRCRRCPFSPTPPRQAAFDSLPFPLNWFVPWSARREMRRQLAAVDGAAAYADAAEALGALADRLRASKGRFFFGDRPSSLDALVFGHVAFYLLSPIAAPVLRAKAQGQPALARFVEGILAREFSFEAPPPPAGDDAGGWSSEAQVRRVCRVVRAVVIVLAPASFAASPAPTSQSTALPSACARRARASSGAPRPSRSGACGAAASTGSRAPPRPSAPTSCSAATTSTCG
jgi:hypothetical protein